LVFFTFSFHKPIIEFLEVNGTRLYTADLWSDLVFVSFGQVFMPVAENGGADRISKQRKQQEGNRRRKYVLSVLWYRMMYGPEDAMHKRLKKLLTGLRATEN
ncbi:unnamed protein product, partial [Brassica rapa subsp. trilocularis]